MKFIHAYLKKQENQENYLKMMKMHTKRKMVANSMLKIRILMPNKSKNEVFFNNKKKLRIISVKKILKT